MAQKWLVPREIVKTKAAQRKEVTELKEIVTVLKQKVEEVSNKKKGV